MPQNPLDIPEILSQILEQLPKQDQLQLRNTSKSFAASVKLKLPDPMKIVSLLLDNTPQNTQLDPAGLSSLDDVASLRLSQDKSVWEKLLLALLDNHLDTLDINAEEAVIALVSLDSIPALNLQLLLRNNHQLMSCMEKVNTAKTAWDWLLYALLTTDVNTIDQITTKEALVDPNVLKATSEINQRLRYCIMFTLSIVFDKKNIIPKEGFANIGIKNLSRVNMREWQVVCSDLDLTGANLGGANLNHAIFKEVSLHHAYMKGAKLIGSWINACDLDQADLSDAVLNVADFDKSTFRNANLYHAACVKTTFRETILTKANLAMIDGTHADFYAADLSEATLSGAKLENTVLDRTNLDKATIIETDLTHCIFHQTNLSHANLSGSKLAPGPHYLAKLEVPYSTVTRAILIGGSFMEKPGFRVNFVQSITDQNAILSITDLAKAIINNEIQDRPTVLLRQICLTSLNVMMSRHADYKPDKHRALKSLRDLMSQRPDASVADLHNILTSWESSDDKVSRKTHHQIIAKRQYDLHLFKKPTQTEKTITEMRLALESVARWESKLEKTNKPK